MLLEASFSVMKCRKDIKKVLEVIDNLGYATHRIGVAQGSKNHDTETRKWVSASSSVINLESADSKQTYSCLTQKSFEHMVKTYTWQMAFFLSKELFLADTSSVKEGDTILFLDKNFQDKPIAHPDSLWTDVSYGAEDPRPPRVHHAELLNPGVTTRLSILKRSRGDQSKDPVYTLQEVGERSWAPFTISEAIAAEVHPDAIVTDGSKFIGKSSLLDIVAFVPYL